MHVSENCFAMDIVESDTSLRYNSYNLPSSITGMWLHSENSSVCKAALAALCNISVNVDSNQVCEITSEDLDSVVQVMRVHQTVKAVQESAIILLRNFTFSPANVLVLEQSPFLASLVKSAMSTHNDHFQGRAEDLLRVLPPPTSQ